MPAEAHATQMKGTGLMSSANWIKQTYGEATYKEVVRSLSRPAAESLTSPLATEWYPVEHISEVWSTVRRTMHPDDPEGFERAMRDLGRFVASDNLSTVFRVLLAFVSSPEQMFRSIDRFWAQYFHGVRVENDESELDQKRGTTRVYGLGDVQYLAPVASGWTELGFQKVGAEHVRCEEEAFAEGKTTADPLVFRVSWQ